MRKKNEGRKFIEKKSPQINGLSFHIGKSHLTCRKMNTDDEKQHIMVQFQNNRQEKFLETSRKKKKCFLQRKGTKMVLKTLTATWEEIFFKITNDVFNSGFYLQLIC